MRKSPSVWGLFELMDHCARGFMRETAGGARRWVPARPEGLPGLRQRIRAGWLVFVGRADALVWPDGQ